MSKKPRITKGIRRGLWHIWSEADAWWQIKRDEFDEGGLEFSAKDVENIEAALEWICAHSEPRERKGEGE